MNAKNLIGRPWLAAVAGAAAVALPAGALYLYGAAPHAEEVDAAPEQLGGFSSAVPPERMIARGMIAGRQETDALWQARQSCPLSPAQWEQVRALFASRQRASICRLGMR